MKGHNKSFSIIKCSRHWGHCPMSNPANWNSTRTSRPDSHHVKIAQDLKDRIERNWLLSQAAKVSSNEAL